MTENDPWADADNPTIKSSFDYYGQVKVDTFYCVLTKGVGKAPFDPGKNNIDQRRTAIDINIFPLPEMNITFDVSRNMIAESREWAGTVLPSIKALGISPRELNGKWAHVRTKGTGSTYASNKTGETVERTTFEFLAIYPTEAECRAAYQAASNGTPVAQAVPAQQPVNGNGSSKEKETAAKFLSPIINNAVSGQTDLEVIRNTVAANLAAMPMVGKYFTVDSPEVMTLIAERMMK